MCSGWFRRIQDCSVILSPLKLNHHHPGRGKQLIQNRNLLTSREEGERENVSCSRRVSWERWLYWSCCSVHWSVWCAVQPQTQMIRSLCIKNKGRGHHHELNNLSSLRGKSESSIKAPVNLCALRKRKASVGQKEQYFAPREVDLLCQSKWNY